MDDISKARSVSIPQLNMYLTAFCDILGTKELVSQGRFTDLHSLDFSGAVAIAAHKFPSARFAVFSDCVILSLPAADVAEFIEIIQFLWGEWMSDGIWVRGGIDLGDATWVDSSLDPSFKRIANLSIARIYGKSVIGSYEVERSSGPGILPFLSDRAATHIIANCNSSCIALSSPILRFCQQKHLMYWAGFLGGFLSEKTSPSERRQLEATIRVIHLFQRHAEPQR